MKWLYRWFWTCVHDRYDRRVSVSKGNLLQLSTSGLTQHKNEGPWNWSTTVRGDHEYIQSLRCRFMLDPHFTCINMSNAKCNLQTCQLVVWGQVRLPVSLSLQVVRTRQTIWQGDCPSIDRGCSNDLWVDKGETAAAKGVQLQAFHHNYSARGLGTRST